MDFDREHRCRAGPARDARCGGRATVLPITRSLPFQPPYAWDAMLGFLAARAIPRVEAVIDGCYLRVISLDEVCGWIRVCRAPRANALRVTIDFASAQALPVIVRRLRNMFDLDSDPAVIAAHLAGDAHLAQLVARRPGLRVPGTWDNFELATRAILGQQVTLHAARALAGKLAARCATRVTPQVDSPFAELDRAFPSAQQVASVTDIAGALGMPRARASALQGLARASLEDPRLLEPGRGLEESVARLRAMPGFGEWTAHYVSMRAFREADAFPASDIGLQRACAVSGVRPSAKQLRARSEPWRPCRAYAALHLWTADAMDGAARKNPGNGLGAGTAADPRHRGPSPHGRRVSP